MMRLAIWGVAARQKEIIQEMHRLGVLHIGQNGAQKEAGPEGLAALRLLRVLLLFGIAYFTLAQYFTQRCKQTHDPSNDTGQQRYTV